MLAERTVVELPDDAVKTASESHGRYMFCMCRQVPDHLVKFKMFVHFLLPKDALEIVPFFEHQLHKLAGLFQVFSASLLELTLNPLRVERSGEELGIVQVQTLENIVDIPS